MNKILAFCGVRNTGKDTSADMLMYLLSTPKILHNYWIYTKLSKFKFNTG